MTMDMMALVPQLGNIASGIATIAATEQASQEISASLSNTTAPTIETAPDTYQSTINAAYGERFPKSTQYVLGFVGSMAWLRQTYTAASSIWLFCRSYEYTNAGTSYQNCPSFSQKYLPSSTDFDDVVNTMVDGSFSGAPKSTSTLQNNIQSFASDVAHSPNAWGQQSGAIGSVQTLQFFLMDSNTSEALYEGSIKDGSVSFSLSAASSLLDNMSFDILGLNIRIIDVQTYWRGVNTTFNGVTVGTNINVGGHNLVYEKDSGTPIPYQLPSFPNPFAKSSSIQSRKCSSGVSQVVTLQFPDDTESKFCNSISKTVQEAFDGLSGSNFLFPSLFSTWTIEADQITWTKEVDIDEDNLALAVVFQYVTSPTTPQTITPLQDCYFQCKSATGNPLLGVEWCTQENCEQCGVSNFDQPYCLCNSWSAAFSTCPALANTTDMYQNRRFIKTSPFTVNLSSRR